MRLGVLGGTFDPVHVAHLVLAESARDELSLERVLFVPAGQPWRKADREITPAEDRLAMVRLAIQDNAAFEVSTMEIDSPGPSYTADTLAALKQQYSERDLYLVLGTDAFEDMPNWKEPARIAELATIAVTRRHGYREGVEVARHLQDLGLGDRVVWFHMPPLGLTSTAVRELVALGRSIRYLVPAAVEAYIAEHGLYRGQVPQKPPGL